MLNAHIFYPAEGTGIICLLDNLNCIHMGVSNEDIAPAIRLMIKHMERVNRWRDPLIEFTPSDALFGFTVHTHLEIQGCEAVPPELTPLKRLLQIGVYDRDSQDEKAGPGEAIQYAAILGNGLLSRV